MLVLDEDFIDHLGLNHGEYYMISKPTHQWTRFSSPQDSTKLFSSGEGSKQKVRASLHVGSD